MSALLKTNKIITTMDLSNNSITSDGVWAIAQALLQGNKTVKQIHLVCNPGETDEVNMPIITKCLESNNELAVLGIV